MMNAQVVKTRARELGFDFAGIIRAEPSPTLDAYLRWIAAGLHGAMAYMARPDRVARRRDLNVMVPGARSLVIVGLDYSTFAVPPDVLNDPSRGRIAAYAWGVDYHDVMTPRLEQLAAEMRAMLGADIRYRVYVDTGAVLERSHAEQAGFGFVGKNTMLIHPRRGSNFFIGEIISDIEFDVYDKPRPSPTCGHCTRCLNACPTGAFPAPYVLDARRCISYHTIENQGWIDRDLREKFGNWVYGCDICQDICPFQRFAQPTGEPCFYPLDVDRAAPKLLDLLVLDDDSFKAGYHDSPIIRIKRQRLVRNACIAAGNWGEANAVPALINLLEDTSSLVRGHAAWALGRIMGRDAAPWLAATLERETDNAAREEIAVVLQTL